MGKQKCFVMFTHQAAVWRNDGVFSCCLIDLALSALLSVPETKEADALQLALTWQ